MKDKLPALVHDIDIRTRHDLGVIIKETGLPEWTYGEKLPEKIGRFELFIRPENAIEYINGSIIFWIIRILPRATSWYFCITVSAMNFCRNQACPET